MTKWRHHLLTTQSWFFVSWLLYIYRFTLCFVFDMKVTPLGWILLNCKPPSISGPVKFMRNNRGRNCLYCILIYGVIHKSLRDFRPLRYSNRDGHAEGELVNKGRDTPSFCPTLQVLNISTLGDAEYVKFGNFGKFQDSERFLISCLRHVSSRLPPSGETCK